MNYAVSCTKPSRNSLSPNEVPISLDFNKAIDELKSGIYIDSLRYGPEHIVTNQNYF